MQGRDDWLQRPLQDAAETGEDGDAEAHEEEDQPAERVRDEEDHRGNRDRPQEDPADRASVRRRRDAAAACMRPRDRVAYERVVRRQRLRPRSLGMRPLEPRATSAAWLSWTWCAFLPSSVITSSDEARRGDVTVDLRFRHASRVAYDEELAVRIRALVAREDGVHEQRMFGGLAFLVNGNMAVSASGQGGLMLRVDPGGVGSSRRGVVSAARRDARS